MIGTLNGDSMAMWGVKNGVVKDCLLLFLNVYTAAARNIGPDQMSLGGHM